MKTKLILLTATVCLLFATQNTNAQTWKWAKQNTSGYFFEESSGMSTIVNPLLTTDKFGNFYLYSTRDYCSYPPGLQFDSSLVPEFGRIFLVKFDSNGHVKWIKSFGAEDANGITTDTLGNIYIVGTCYDSVFICGNDTVHLNHPTAQFGGFLAKIDTAGNTILAKSIGGSTAKCNSICIDNTNKINVAGMAKDSSVFDTIIFNNGMSCNFFTAKYNEAGNIIWVRGISSWFANFSSILNSNAMQEIPMVTNDKFGNVIVALNTDTDYIYFNSILTHIIGDTICKKRILIIKYDSVGNLLWHKSPVGNENTHCLVTCLKIDANANIFISGYIDNIAGKSITFDTTTLVSTTTLYGFFAKLSSSSNLLWAKRTSSSILSNATDMTGNVFVIYDSINTMLNKYDSIGNLLWSKSNWHSNPFSLYSTTVAINKLGMVFLAGSFYYDSIAFGQDTLSCLLFSPIGGYIYDFFIAKTDTGAIPLIITNTEQTGKNIKIYPNPANNIIIIELPPNTKNALITLYDIYGRNIDEKETTNKTEFKLQGLPKGLYIANINIEGINYKEKLIIN